MLLDILAQLTNRCEREARLNLALLALIPPRGVAVGFYGVELHLNATRMGVASTFGVFPPSLPYCASPAAGLRSESSCRP